MLTWQPRLFDLVGELSRRELAALVGINNVRRAVAIECFGEYVYRVTCLQGDSHAMRQHLAAGPVDDHREIDKTTRHRHVDRVQVPYLVRAVDGEVPERVWINRVSRMALARAGAAVQGFDAHPPHQCTHMLASRRGAFSLQLWIPTNAA